MYHGITNKCIKGKQRIFFDNIKVNKTGFTLLELIIVIIIVGVLTSLALPKLFIAIEHTRSVEALASLASLRREVETCLLMNNDNIESCMRNSKYPIFLEGVNNAPNAHFVYDFYDTGHGGGGYEYGLRASRNSHAEWELLRI